MLEITEEFAWAISNYPQAFQTDYREQRLFELDSNLNAVLGSFKPRAWTEKSFKKEPLFAEVMLSHFPRISGWGRALQSGFPPARE